MNSKRFPGLSKILQGAFFFLAAILLCTPCLFAAAKTVSSKGKTPPQITAAPEKAKETYIQQIGPAAEEPSLDGVRLFDTVPANKPLISSTQFKVVDDFFTSDFKNRFNAPWILTPAKPERIQILLSQDDSRGLHNGHSLAVRFDLRKQEQFTLSSSLARLDMSAAHFLALKCKIEPAGKTSFEGRVRVTLTDWAGKTIGRDITGVCSETKEWNNVILPRAIFKGIDFDQLDHMDFTVEARDKRNIAKLALDEIAFFGHPEVGFESTEDNLKGFPRVVFDGRRRSELLKISKDEQFLTLVAQDTWRYFQKAVNRENNLLVDHIKVGHFPLAAMYTSPTNIAMDLMATVGAFELGFISKKEASERAANILASLRKLKRWKGFFFNFYETTRLNPTNNFISSVDNGWLAISLVVVRQAFSNSIEKEATALLNEMHFQEFLDPENNHLAIGYDLERNSPTPYHYGMLVTEARAMSFLGIGKGDLPRQHWWYLYRTAPEVWDWQTQKPKGKMVEREGIQYFQGYYEENGKKFTPSWGGSLFEFLMPTLVINEKKLAPKGLGLNDKTATELHRDYALKEKKYPVWGISPAATASGRQWQYGEYGIKKMGAKGYPDKGVLTPHAAFLALETLPEDAIKNLRAFLKFEIYGEYGFYDSISFPGEKVNTQYLALDQGMIFIALANYLKQGVIQKYFQKDPIAQKAKDLLEEESFFE